MTLPASTSPSTNPLTLSLSKGQADARDGGGFDKLSLSAFSGGAGA